MVGGESSSVCQAPDKKLPRSTCSRGHLRWATHGRNPRPSPVSEQAPDGWVAVQDRSGLGGSGKMDEEQGVGDWYRRRPVAAACRYRSVVAASGIARKSLKIHGPPSGHEFEPRPPGGWTGQYPLRVTEPVPQVGDSRFSGERSPAWGLRCHPKRFGLQKEAVGYIAASTTGRGNRPMRARAST